MTATRARLLWVAGAGGVGLALAGAAALSIVYLERASIGVAVAVDYLRRQGVPARIRIDRLDAQGVSGALVLGPRGDPDLSVERVDVDFAPIPALGPKVGFKFQQGLGPPRVSAVRLVRPRLRARFDGRRLTFGSLQGLIDEAARAPASGPGPDVTIQDGRLELASPLGRALVFGDGVLRQGRIVWLRAELAPGSLAGAGVRLDGLGGGVRAHALGRDRLAADWRLAARTAVAGAASARGVELSGAGEAPYGAAGRLDGPLTAQATLLAQVVQAQIGQSSAANGAGARGVSITARLGGEARGPLRAPSFDGAAAMSIHASDAAWRGPGPHAPQAAFRQVVLALTAARLRLDPPPAARTGATMRLQAPLQLAIDGRDGRATLGGRRLALSRVAARGSGLAEWSQHAMRVRCTGSTQADGGLSGPDAARLVRGLVPAGAGAALRQALARDLRGFHLRAPAYALALTPGRSVVRLGAPVVARFDGGASAQVAGRQGAPALDLSRDRAEGAMAARLAGPGLPSVRLDLDGYRLAGLDRRPSVFLRGAMEARGDVGPALGVSAQVRATVRAGGGGFVVTAQDCASASLARYADPSGAAVLSEAAMHLCPASAPLLSLHGRRWTSAGRIEALHARLPGVEAVLSGGTATFELNGVGAEPRGEVALRLRLADAAAPARFHDLAVAGGAQATGIGWRGALDLSLPSRGTLSQGAVPLGRVTLAYDPPDRRAEAQFRSADLRFTPDGLQPGAIAPGLARWASRVQGGAAVSADLVWDGHALVSRGEVATAGLDLQSEAGPVKGLRGDLRFASLAPLISAPDQRLAADRLEAFVPLSDLRLAFDLAPDHAVLRSARATLASGEVGLDPMTLVLEPPGAPVAGALRLSHVDIGELIKGLDIADAVSLQARISGALPFALGPQGLRFAGGRVAADGPGRLTIRRQALAGATTQTPTVQPNAVQDFAYQALEDLAFDTLEAGVESRPLGRLGVVLHVKGRHDPAFAPPTRIGLIALLRGRAFDKPIPLPKGTPVDLTLDTSLNFDELLAAYGGLQSPAGSAGVHAVEP